MKTIAFLILFCSSLIFTCCEDPWVGERHRAVDTQVRMRKLANAIAQRELQDIRIPSEGKAVTLVKALNLKEIETNDGWGRPMDYKLDSDGSIILLSWGADGKYGSNPKHAIHYPNGDINYDNDIIARIRTHAVWFEQDWTGSLPRR